MLILMGIVFVLMACYSEEDLTHSGNYSVTKFIFPQGDNAWDMDIKDIHDRYNVYLIYKEVTFVDLNRQWQSLGTGDLFSGDSLTNEQVPVYVDFLKNHFFAFISPEIAQKALPVKIYMLHNFKKVTSGDDTGETDTGDTGGTGTGTGTGTGGTGTGTGGTGTGTGGTGTGGTDPNFVPLKIDGFDYWAISFTDDEMNNMDPYSKKVKRNIFFRTFIENAIRKGSVTEPTDFKNEMDYKTRINTNKPEDPDYYLTRGFLDLFKERELSSRAPYFMDEYTGAGFENPDIYPHADFVYYIRAAMWYTPDEFETHYPAEKYPLIKKKYDVVIHHLKSAYGIDIQQIAKGPQE